MHVSTFLLKEDNLVSGPARTYFIFLLSQTSASYAVGVLFRCFMPSHQHFQVHVGYDLRLWNAMDK